MSSILSAIVPHLNLEAPALRQVGLRLAKTDGVNLAQGLCIMPVPSPVLEGAEAALHSGKNLYSPAQGIPELRSALAERLRSFNQIPCDEDSVVVTTGSTGAFEAVCAAFIRPGDEVVSFIPFYPYHQNALDRHRAITRYIPLLPPSWEIDWGALDATLSSRTRFLLLTTPNNPTGKVFSRAELERIAELCRDRNIFCVTDEVYEYMTYEGFTHTSLASLPGMAERVITMSSYSKTFAITGWRIGFLAAAKEVAEVLKVTFDQIAVCAPTPLQHGVAHGIRSLGEEYYAQLRGEYTRKRRILLGGLERAGFIVRPPDGAYYLMADVRERFPGKSSEEVVDILVDSIGVGAVPAADFVGASAKRDPKRSYFLRFSYAVPDALLEDTCARLLKL